MGNNNPPLSFNQCIDPVDPLLCPLPDLPVSMGNEPISGTNPPARWVNIFSDPELAIDCCAFRSLMESKGYSGTVFQLQTVQTDGASADLLLVIVPNGKVVDGQPHGVLFAFVSTMLESAHIREQIADTLVTHMQRMVAQEADTTPPSNG